MRPVGLGCVRVCPVERGPRSLQFRNCKGAIGSVDQNWGHQMGLGATERRNRHRCLCVCCACALHPRRVAGWAAGQAAGKRALVARTGCGCLDRVQGSSRAWPCDAEGPPSAMPLSPHELCDVLAQFPDGLFLRYRQCRSRRSAELLASMMNSSNHRSLRIRGASSDITCAQTIASFRVSSYQVRRAWLRPPRGVLRFCGSPQACGAASWRAPSPRREHWYGGAWA
jgi:hypothetical protein